MVRECYIKLVNIVEERSDVHLLGEAQSEDSEMEAAAVAGMHLEKGYIGDLFCLTISCI